MSTIQVVIKVSDEILARYGAQALAERFQKMVAWEELSLQAKEMNKALEESGSSFDEIAKEVRHETWLEFKKTHLADVLPE